MGKCSYTFCISFHSLLFISKITESVNPTCGIDEYHIICLCFGLPVVQSWINSC
jgi:hypothetical protein